MNMAERNARMMVAVKIMAEVFDDAWQESEIEGVKLNNYELWRRCGMPAAAHGAQVIEFLKKQDFQFLGSKTVNRERGDWSAVEHPGEATPQNSFERIRRSARYS